MIDPDVIVAAWAQLWEVADGANCGLPWVVAPEEAHPYPIASIGDVGVCIETPPLREFEELDGEAFGFPSIEAIAHHVATFDPATVKAMLLVIERQQLALRHLREENELLRDQRSRAEVLHPSMLRSAS